MPLPVRLFLKVASTECLTARVVPDTVVQARGVSVSGAYSAGCEFFILLPITPERGPVNPL